jgi:hypothetical protein
MSFDPVSDRLQQINMTRWTGPREDEIDALGRLYVPVPPERWPYGPPSSHEASCLLYRGSRYCDCAASDASSLLYGEIA